MRGSEEGQEREGGTSERDREVGDRGAVVFPAPGAGRVCVSVSVSESLWQSAACGLGSGWHDDIYIPLLKDSHLELLMSVNQTEVPFHSRQIVGISEHHH